MIEVQNLHYQYPGNRENTIKGIDFHIQKGEVFGFLGPSGAGKSTIQKILIGLLKDYKGSVRVMGRELGETGSDYQEKIGVAFEFPNFYQRFTALENLSFFRSLYSVDMENPRELLRIVGLEKYGDMKVSGFSKGMKMRLNLCRALLNKPELIFLDEPTSGLDPTNAKMVKDLILKKKEEGRTILITTHNMYVAEEICDRVAFIVDGKIALIDSPRELMIRKGEKRVRVEYRERGSIQSVDFELERIGMNDSFLRLLQEKEIETMHTLETTLEQIFIEVTGRNLS